MRWPESRSRSPASHVRGTKMKLDKEKPSKNVEDESAVARKFKDDPGDMSPNKGGRLDTIEGLKDDIDRFTRRIDQSSARIDRTLGQRSNKDTKSDRGDSDGLGHHKRVLKEFEAGKFKK